MFTELRTAATGRLNIVAPVFPGQADRVGEAFSTVTMDDCADDVLRTLDRLGIGQFSIAAQSMGADVAVRIAARYPDRVGRMVLMGASVCAEPPEQRAGFEGLSAQMSDGGFTPMLVEIIMNVLFGASTLRDPARGNMLAAVEAQLAKIPPNFIHAARGVVERESAVHLLPLVHAPTLVISGTEDRVRPPAWSDEIFDGVADCQLWRLKRVGHSPLLEAPALVIPRLIDFLTAA